MRSVVAVVNLLLLVGLTLARPTRGPGRGGGGTRGAPLSQLSVTEQTALAQQVVKMLDEANLPCGAEAKVTLGQAALVTALRITMEESMWALLGALEGVETVLPADLEVVTDTVGEEMETVLTGPLIDDMEAPRFQGLYKAMEVLDRVSNIPTDRMLLSSGLRLATLAKNNCDKLLTLQDSMAIVSDIKNGITAGRVETLKTDLLSKLTTLIPSAALETLRPHLVGLIDTTVEQLQIVVSVGEQLTGGSTPALLPALETLISAIASKRPLIEPIMMSAPDHMNPFNDLNPSVPCYKQRATAINLVALTVAYGIDQALLRDKLFEHLPTIPGVDMMDAADKIAQAIETEATAVDTLAEQTLVNTPLKAPFLAFRKNLPRQDVTFFVSEKLPLVAMAIRRMIDRDNAICTMDTAPIRNRLISILDQVKTKYTHSAFEDTVRMVLKTAYTDQTLAEQALNRIKNPLASYTEEHAKTVAEFSDHLRKGDLVTGVLREMLEDLDESLEEDTSEESNEIETRTVGGAETEGNSAETSLESNEVLTGKKPNRGPGSGKTKFPGSQMGRRPSTTPAPISETLIRRIEEMLAAAETNPASTETSAEGVSTSKEMAGKKPNGGPKSGKPKFTGSKIGRRPPTTTPEPASETLIRRLEEALAAAEEKSAETSAETSLESNEVMTGKKPKPGPGKPRFTGFHMGRRPQTTTMPTPANDIIKRLEEALTATNPKPAKGEHKPMGPHPGPRPHHGEKPTTTPEPASEIIKRLEALAASDTKPTIGEPTNHMVGLPNPHHKVKPIATPKPTSEIIKRLEEALTATNTKPAKEEHKPMGPHPGPRPHHGEKQSTTPEPASEIIKRLAALITADTKPAKEEHIPMGPNPGPRPHHGEKQSTTPEPASEIIKRLESLAATNPKPIKEHEHSGPHRGPPHYYGEKPTTTPGPAVRRQETNTELEPLRPPSSTDTCRPQKILALNIVMLSLLSGVDQMMMRFMLTTFLPAPKQTALPIVLQTLATQLEPEAEAMVDFVRLKDLAGTKLDTVVAAFHTVLPSKSLDYLLSTDLETALNVIRTQIDSNPALCTVDVQTVTNRLVTLFNKYKQRYVAGTFKTALMKGLSQFYTPDEINPVLPEVLEIFEGYREEHQEVINALIPALQHGTLITNVLDPVMEDVAEMLEAERR